MPIIQNGAKRPSHRVLFDPLGLASSLGQNAQEAMADRMGDPTDPMHDSHYQAEEQAFTKQYESRAAWRPVRGPKL